MNHPTVDRAIYLAQAKLTASNTGEIWPLRRHPAGGLVPQLSPPVRHDNTQEIVLCGPTDINEGATEIIDARSVSAIPISMEERQLLVGSRTRALVRSTAPTLSPMRPAPPAGRPPAYLSYAAAAPQPPLPVAAAPAIVSPSRPLVVAVSEEQPQIIEISSQQVAAPEQKLLARTAARQRQVVSPQLQRNNERQCSPCIPDSKGLMQSPFRPSPATLETDVAREVLWGPNRSIISPPRQPFLQ